jgi:hypothetical protein
MAKAGFVYRQAQVRGLLGGSRPWTILWVVLLGRRILRRLLADKPEVVYSETLQPGQTLVISSKDREPRIIGA